MADSTHPLQPIERAPTPFLTNEVAQQRVFELVAAGNNLSTSMVLAGYDRNMIYQYRKAARDGKWAHGDPIQPETMERIVRFLEQLEHAIALGEAKLVATVVDAAGRVNEKTGLSDWQPAKFLLTHGPARGNWYTHQEPQVIDMTHHNESHPEFRDAKNLSDAELLEGIDDPEWANLLGPGKVIDG